MGAVKTWACCVPGRKATRIVTMNPCGECVEKRSRAGVLRRFPNPGVCRVQMGVQDRCVETGRGVGSEEVWKPFVRVAFNGVGLEVFL